MGYVQDIESVAIGNDDFRRVLYTARNCQIVLMALKPQEDIGAEVHKLDQFFRVDQGRGGRGRYRTLRWQDVGVAPRTQMIATAFLFKIAAKCTSLETEEKSAR